MRADRLLSLLMLLQIHRRMTARRLARELEVSERTIYRDILALSSAGVPVYGLGGPDGGYALVEDYHTDLTGLNEGERRALFLLPAYFLANLPEPLVRLGVGRDLRSALRKLSAALPDPQAQDEQQLRRRFHLDPNSWESLGEQGPAGRPPNANPHLETIYKALWSDSCLWIRYQPLPVEPVERLVAPYGLVVKDGSWYLVYSRQSRLQVIPVAELLEARSAAETFTLPTDFDLAAFWQTWCAERGRRQRSFRVIVRVAPDFLPWLPRYLGASIRDRPGAAISADAQSRVKLDLAFESFEAARDRLLSCGCGVEVIEPQSLRFSLADAARQVASLYE